MLVASTVFVELSHAFIICCIHLHLSVAERIHGVTHVFFRIPGTRGLPVREP